VRLVGIQTSKLNHFTEIGTLPMRRPWVAFVATIDFRIEPPFPERVFPTAVTAEGGEV
jgi:hypothetical protein